MSNVGDACELMENVQRDIDSKLSFICNKESLYGQDLFALLENLRMLKKNTTPPGPTFSDPEKGLYVCPCVTKFLISLEKKFPKETKRDPFTCAKIQYALYDSMSGADKSNYLKTQITQFKADCKDCYLMAANAIYYGDKVCLKK